jgi:aspartokinase
VEIWTGREWPPTADPRIVPAARTLRAASYEEAAELATFGAKVLHPATAMPLVRAGIPLIVVLNSLRPQEPGTTIGPSAELERLGDSPIRSISLEARDHRPQRAGPRCSAPTASSGRCSRSSSATRWWWTSWRAER